MKSNPVKLTSLERVFKAASRQLTPATLMTAHDKIDEMNATIAAQSQRIAALEKALGIAEQMMVTFAMTFPHSWSRRDQNKLNEIRALLATRTDAG